MSRLTRVNQGSSHSRALSVTLVGINYAPEPSGIGPFTAQLAEHYSNQGHSVDVVTGIPHYPSWRGERVIDPPSRGPTICRYGHFVPGGPTLVGRLLYEGTWLGSALRAFPRIAADVIIGVVPSLSGGVLAALFRNRRRGTKLGIIFQDLMGPATQQSGHSGGSGVARAVASVEGAVARRADRVAVIGAGFTDYLVHKGVHQDRIQHIPNWARRSVADLDQGAVRRHLGWGDDFVCLHAGSIGQKQGIDSLIRAAQHLQGQGVRIVFVGDGNDRERVERMAKAMGLSSVDFIGTQPDARYRALLEAADVLLLCQRPEVENMALPSRLATYLDAGKPVVAAVSDTSEAAAELRGSGAGVFVPPGNAPALAKAVLELRQSPIQCATMGADGRAFAERHLSVRAAMSAYDVFLEQLRPTNYVGDRDAIGSDSF